MMIRSLFAASLLLFAPCYASVQEAAENFATKMFAEREELRNGLSAFGAATQFLNTVKNDYDQVFFLTEADRSAIKNNKEVITDADFQSRLENIGANTDPIANYVVNYVNTSPPKGYERVFLYRFMEKLPNIERAVKAKKANPELVEEVAPASPEKTNLSSTSDIVQQSSDPLYMAIIEQGAAVIIATHRLFKKSTAYVLANENNIDLLKLKNGANSYQSQDGKSSYTWIYLGATHHILVDKKRVICMTSTPVSNGKHLGFLKDQTAVEITIEQFEQIKLHGIK